MKKTIVLLVTLLLLYFNNSNSAHAQSFTAPQIQDILLNLKSSSTGSNNYKLSDIYQDDNDLKGTLSIAHNKGIPQVIKEEILQPFGRSSVEIYLFKNTPILLIEKEENYTSNSHKMQIVFKATYTINNWTMDEMTVKTEGKRPHLKSCSIYEYQSIIDLAVKLLKQ